jgi:hypothetical protein
VTIENLGPLVEHITADILTNLVDFELQSLSPSTCPAPVLVLVLPKKRQQDDQRHVRRERVDRRNNEGSAQLTQEKACITVKHLPLILPHGEGTRAFGW